MHHQFHNLIQI